MSLITRYLHKTITNSNKILYSYRFSSSLTTVQHHSVFVRLTQTKSIPLQCISEIVKKSETLFIVYHRDYISQNGIFALWEVRVSIEDHGFETIKYLFEGTFRPSELK